MNANLHPAADYLVATYGLQPADYEILPEQERIVVLPQGIESLRARLGKVRITYRLEQSRPWGATVMALAKVGAGPSLRVAEALGSASRETCKGAHAFVETAQARARGRVILELSDLHSVGSLLVATSVERYQVVAPAIPSAPQKFRNSEQGAFTKQDAIDYFGVSVAPEPEAEPEVVPEPLVKGKPEAAPAEPDSINPEASAGAAPSGKAPHALAHLSDEELRDTLQDMLSHKMIWTQEKRACVAKLPDMGREKLLSGIDFYEKTIAERLLDGKNQ